LVCVQILANYGIDAISSLAGTCILLFEAHTNAKVVKRLLQLSCDVAVACVITTLHGLTIMCQAIIYAVALNGSRNGLVALLIATQFAEVKGITYRRVDDSKLLHMVQMVCGFPERFLLIADWLCQVRQEAENNILVQLLHAYFSRPSTTLS
jgi:hypothetical protein